MFCSSTASKHLVHNVLILSELDYTKFPQEFFNGKQLSKKALLGWPNSIKGIKVSEKLLWSEVTECWFSNEVQRLPGLSTARGNVIYFEQKVKIKL